VSWLNRPGWNWGAWFPRYNIYRNIACTVPGHSSTILDESLETGNEYGQPPIGPTPIWCHSTCGSGVRYSGCFSTYPWTKPYGFSVSTLISVFTPITHPNNNKHAKPVPFNRFTFMYLLVDLRNSGPRSKTCSCRLQPLRVDRVQGISTWSFCCDWSICRPSPQRPAVSRRMSARGWGQRRPTHYHGMYKYSCALTLIVW